jgi:hypothetical protein
LGQSGKGVNLFSLPGGVFAEFSSEEGGDSRGDGDGGAGIENQGTGAAG